MLVDYHKLLIECRHLQKGATREQKKTLQDLERRIEAKIKLQNSRSPVEYEDYILKSLKKS